MNFASAAATASDDDDVLMELFFCRWHQAFLFASGSLDFEAASVSVDESEERTPKARDPAPSPLLVSMCNPDSPLSKTPGRCFVLLVGLP